MTGIWGSYRLLVMGSCPELELFLFPVDGDPHEFFCNLQSNVFDAASLFQINHVVHRNAPRAWGHFSCVASWLSSSYYVMFILNMFIFKGKAYCGFVCHRTANMATVYQLKVKFTQDKSGVVFAAANARGSLKIHGLMSYILAWNPPFLNKKRMLLSLSLLLWMNMT